MDPLNSSLVVIVADDDQSASAYKRRARARGANVCPRQKCTVADLSLLGRTLAAVVIDVRSMERAWNLVSGLRLNPETESVPVLLRFDSRGMTVDLMLTLNDVWGIDARDGVDVACDDLERLLESLAKPASAKSGAAAWAAQVGARLQGRPHTA